MNPTEDVIRRYYGAYETGDREVMESLLSADFTFTSPVDDRIDRATYFAKCWAYHEQLRSFDLQQVMVEDRHALVRYRAEEHAGPGFGNVEHFEFDARGRVLHVDVYFGALPA